MPEKYAIDCEMVESFGRNILARVSIVDYYERCVYDTFVKPTAPVTDYREFITGITREDLQSGKNMRTVQFEVANILTGNIVVGHSLHFDFAVLGILLPDTIIRDLAKYQPFLERNNFQPIGLRRLAWKYLGRNIQTHVHCSVEDARASMGVYKKVEYQWENITSWSSIILKAVVVFIVFIFISDLVSKSNKK